jgi:superfamily II DNA/RNA helicase
MSDEFEIVRRILAGGTIEDPDSVKELAHRRLINAWSSVDSFAAGPSDLAVLTRHVLRGEQVRQSGISPTLAVPRVIPWPNEAEWERFGIDVIGETQTHLQLRSHAWSPSWLPDSVRYDVDGPASAGESRRDYGECTRGDPFLDPFPEWQNYRCAGQREAVRGVLTAPSGATLVVNLATGAGKSLCAHLPALLDSSGLTVVVMPTTALALDQERVLSDRIRHQTAYHGGEDAATKARNQGIRERLKAGTQRILFASPESVVKGLAGALYAAAGHGVLQLLAIDEAHMIDQWGDDFRPEFQELAGLRQDLLRRCAGRHFKTLLLSGTVTESCLDTLETLFGRPGPFDVVSAVQLRPEPAYWIASCLDEPTRQDRVLEALRHLPRPLILYTTRVEDADRWLEMLSSAGFKRSASVTGKSKPQVRAATLESWQNGQVDLVVATSAFGLGMDKSDVRAVVHACIPEHIDRYYQEVGRGGRDGRASVSLLVHTPADRGLASDLNQKTALSVQKGFARWKKMYFNREQLSDGRVRVPIHLIPEYGYGEFTDSKRNDGWNIHTLAMLARSGVIDLDAQPPPRQDEFLGEDGEIDEEKYQAEFERHHNQRVIRVLDDDLHLDFGATWAGPVEQIRGAGYRASCRGIELMYEALAGNSCISKVLAEAYEISVRTEDTPRPGAVVSRGCGGCAACRREGRGPSSGLMPTPRPAWNGVSIDLSAGLALLLGASHHVLVFDDQFGRTDAGERQRRERLLRTLIGKGVQSLVAPMRELDSLRPLLQTPPNPPMFFTEEWRPLYLPKVPTLVFGPSAEMLTAILGSIQPGGASELPTVVWLSADTRDPAKPNSYLIHTANWTWFRLDEFCTRAGV